MHSTDQIQPAGCEQCTDPDGECCFPMYGLGPHTHEGVAEHGWIGSTRMLPQAADGFTPNPDEPGMGWWWCPTCGAGKKATP